MATRLSMALDSLRQLHHDTEARLLRESSDFRVLISLRQSIRLLDEEVRGAPSMSGAPFPAAREGDADSGPPSPPIELLAAMARRSSRRTLPAETGLLTKRDAVVRILRERGEPLPITEIIDQLQQRGVTLGGVRPQGNLSSNLSQDKRFRPVRYRDRACWWLADESLRA
jgi:hypothetical protein